MKTMISFLAILVGFFGNAQEKLPVMLNKTWKLHLDSEPEEKSIQFSGDVYEIQAGKGPLRRKAVFRNEFESPKAGIMQIGCGADYFMLLQINGKTVLDTLDSGNRKSPISKMNHRIDLPVRKGKNQLKITVLSGSAGWSLALGAVPWIDLAKTAPSTGNFRRLEAFALPGTPERTAQEETIQNGVNLMRSNVFFSFDLKPELSEKKKETFFRKHPVLEFYDRALDRVLREVQKENVPEGEVVLWHLYNMGYVVKTHESCFGIDLHHRRAHLLEPFLDFLLITHNHSDHQNPGLQKAIAKNGKKIISNFFPCSGYSRPPETFVFKDITVSTEETDHNSMLKKFMTAFTIRCGRSGNAPVLYHTGDSCNHEQLNPGRRVDVWMVHPRVGLQVIEGVRRFKPKQVFISHLLEMGHCPPSPWNPIPFDDAHEDEEKIREDGIDCEIRIPFWGEKIMLKR